MGRREECECGVDKEISVVLSIYSEVAFYTGGEPFRYCPRLRGNVQCNKAGSGMGEDISVNLYISGAGDEFVPLHRYAEMAEAGRLRRAFGKRRFSGRDMFYGLRLSIFSE